MNNLAWLLVRTVPEETDRALELIEEALDRQPDSCEFLETRGEVYIHLGRLSDAITDLETALRTFPDRTRTHSLLAIAYEQTGNKSLRRGITT